MTQTTHLALPFIEAAQAQKHVTHNEALTLIDALAHLSVAERNVLAPPGAPTEGERLLIGAGATGAFAGKSDKIATFLAGGWTFLSPQAGWRAFVQAESLLLLYDGGEWRDLGLSLRELQNLARLGIGTSADAANPLSVKLNAALFTAKSVGEGGAGDLRVTLNKESAAKTVSQLYQSNWSGRAETGLTGDDNFHVKVSADGASWKEAIVVDRATGEVAFPSGGPTKILTFTSSGTYTPTPGMKFVDVILIGGAGGGGSGGRAGAGVAVAGGGGGGGGGVVMGRFTAAQVGASKAVAIGAGGPGGAVQTANSSAGNNGTAGGATAFGSPFILRAGGGGAGSGGSIGVASAGGGGPNTGTNASGATAGIGGLGATNGGSGTLAANSVTGSTGGGGAPASGGAGGAGGATPTYASGGGAGGGVTAADAASAGGDGGVVAVQGFVATGPGGAAGTNGASGASFQLSGPLACGGSGGGGGGGHATTPGAGGVGGAPGGGAGGGGASRNGANSGAGGAGANGLCIIIEYF